MWFCERWRRRNFLSLFIDFSAPSGKSEAIDARESERDVHQRSVRDDHETAESFGTFFFFAHVLLSFERDLACVCFFARARAARFPWTWNVLFTAMKIFYRSVCHDYNERCDKCRSSRRAIGRWTFASSEPETNQSRERALTRSRARVTVLSLSFHYFSISYCSRMTSTLSV